MVLLTGINWLYATMECFIMIDFMIILYKTLPNLMYIYNLRCIILTIVNPRLMQTSFFFPSKSDCVIRKGISIYFFRSNLYLFSFVWFYSERIQTSQNRDMISQNGDLEREKEA